MSDSLSDEPEEHRVLDTALGPEFIRISLMDLLCCVPVHYDGG